MINRFECRECEGSGHGEPIPHQVGYSITADMAMDAGMPEIEGHMEYEIEWEDQPCPTCEGSGFMVLAVEDTVEIHGDVHGTGEYRPLTDEEVKEMGHMRADEITPLLKDAIHAIMESVKAGSPVQYGGQPVRLIPHKPTEARKEEHEKTD